MFRFDCTFSNFNCTKRVQLHTILRPAHNPTDPIKTTTNLLVQERQLSNRSREEIRDAPNYKFTKQFDANI